MERYLVTLSIFTVAVLAMEVHRIRRDTGTRVDTRYFQLAAHMAGARVVALAGAVLAGVEMANPLVAFLNAATGMLLVHFLVLFAYSFPLNRVAPARVQVPLGIATAFFIALAQHRALVQAEGPYVLLLGLMPSYLAVALFFLHRNWRASIAPGEVKGGAPVTLVQASLVGPWALSIVLFVTFHPFLEGGARPAVLLAQAVAMALVVVGGTGVAVLRYHLYEIRVLMTEVVLAVTASALLAGYLGLGAEPLYAWLSQRVSSSFAPVVVAGLPLFMADVFHAAVSRVGDAAEHGTRAHRAVELALTATARMVDPEEVLATAVRALADATGAPVHFLRAQGASAGGAHAEASPALVALTRAQPRPFYSPEHAPELATALLTELDALGARLVVPVTRHETLYGFFVVAGSRRSTRAESTVCATMADQVALKFENHALYAEAAKANRDLADTRAFLEDLVESLPVGVAVVDSSLRVKTWNRELAAQSGIAARDAIGAGYFDDLYPEFRETEGASVMRELQESPDSVVLRPAARFDTPHGPQYRDLSVAPFKDRDGQPMGVVVITADATERVRLARELEESRQLAALGAFAAGVAHDIRTPLTSIQMNVQILRSRAELVEGDREYLDITLTEIDRLNRSVAEILEFARPLSLDASVVDANDLLVDVTRALQPVYAERGVSIVGRPCPVPAAAQVDERLVRKVLVNLIDNAVDASPRGTSVEVAVSLDGDRVSFAVRDVGRGIDGSLHERIFDPFFTTRADGTGLGLAIARKIVRGHGGDVRVESAPGRGATFTVVLPAATSRPSERG